MEEMKKKENKKIPIFLVLLRGVLWGESKTLVHDGLDVHSGLNKFSEKKMFLVVDKKRGPPLFPIF